MKKLSIVSIVVLAFVCGCATLPPEISSGLLSQPTAEQSAAMKKLESSIVSKKDDKDQVELRYKLSEKMLTISKARLKVQESSKDLVTAELSFYETKKDYKKIDELKVKSSELDKKIALQKKCIDLASSQKDCIKALFDLKTADLAVQVAEMSQLKAEIANDFITKQPAAPAPEKDKPADKSKKIDSKIDMKLYTEFLAKQNDALKIANDDYAKALKEYNGVRDEAVKAGYKGEDDIDVK